MDESWERYREALDGLRLTAEGRDRLTERLAHLAPAPPRPRRRLRPVLAVAASIAVCLLLTAGGWIRLTGLPVYRVDSYDFNPFYTLYTNGVIYFVEVSPLGWGCIGLALLFAAQLALCLKCRRKAVKCIPLYLILLGMLLSVAEYLGIFGSYSAGAISGNQLVGLILALITGIAAAGVAAAWGVYGIILLIRKRTQNRRKDDLS